MPVRAGVFLITLSGLVFEIGLTRIYSATIWYHFAFVVISMALLGWGLGGLAVHLLKRTLAPSMDRAAGLALLYGAAIPACLWVLVRFPFEIDRLPLYFVAPLVPFFLGGMALSMVFDLHRAITGSLYFADLLGASLGAVLVTVLLQAHGRRGVAARGGDRADGRRRLSVAKIPPVGWSWRRAPGRGRLVERQHRSLSRDSRHDQGDAPADGGEPRGLA